MRKRYRFIDGEVRQVAGHDMPLEVDAPFVRQDSFKAALRHPETGEMVNSLTRWNEINKAHKLDIVGNDWKNQGPRNNLPKDCVIEKRFDDAYERAWAIESDPDKRKERRGRQREEVERYYKQGRMSQEMFRTIVQIRELDK